VLFRSRPSRPGARRVLGPLGPLGPPTPLGPLGPPTDRRTESPNADLHGFDDPERCVARTIREFFRTTQRSAMMRPQRSALAIGSSAPLVSWCKVGHRCPFLHDNTVATRQPPRATTASHHRGRAVARVTPPSGRAGTPCPTPAPPRAAGRPGP